MVEGYAGCSYTRRWRSLALPMNANTTNENRGEKSDDYTCLLCAQPTGETPRRLYCRDERGSEYGRILATAAICDECLATSDGWIDNQASEGRQ